MMTKALKEFIIYLSASLLLVFLLVLTTKTDYLFSRRVSHLIFSKTFLSALIFMVMLKPSIRLIEANNLQLYIAWIRFFSPKLSTKKINLLINFVIFAILTYMVITIGQASRPHFSREVHYYMIISSIGLTWFIKNFVIINETGFSVVHFFFLVMVPITAPYVWLLVFSLCSINTNLLLNLWLLPKKDIQIKECSTCRLLKARIKLRNNFKKIFMRIWTMKVFLNIKIYFSDRLRTQKNEHFPGILATK